MVNLGNTSVLISISNLRYAARMAKILTKFSKFHSLNGGVNILDEINKDNKVLAPRLVEYFATKGQLYNCHSSSEFLMILDAIFDCDDGASVRIIFNYI